MLKQFTLAFVAMAALSTSAFANELDLAVGEISDASIAVETPFDADLDIDALTAQAGQDDPEQAQEACYWGGYGYGYGHYGFYRPFFHCYRPIVYTYCYPVYSFWGCW